MTTTITPYLSVSNANLAIEFYQKAFAAEEIGPRLTDPHGNIMHTEFKIGEAVVMLADENPDFGNTSPKTLGGTPVRISLQVDNVDDVATSAVAAGGTLTIPVTDQFYGYRSGRLIDPFGHEWIIGTLIEEVPHDEMQRRADELFGNAGT